MKILFAIAMLLVSAGCATAPYMPAAPQAKTYGSVYQPVTFAKESLFVWPARGYIVAPFGSKIDRVINKGINIKVEEGSYVRAARAGKVVYSDSQLKGYGKTVIIDHGDRYQTVYSYNSDILVNVGDAVKQNEVIAKAGRTGRAKEPTLHFEIRKDGEPQNPANYLSR